MKRQSRIIFLGIAVLAFFVSIFFHKARATSYPMGSLVETPTLEECVQMMGMTDDECRELISGFSNDLESAGLDSNQYDGLMDGLPQNSGQAEESYRIGGEAKAPSKTGNFGAAEVRRQRLRNEENFSKIEKRAEALVDFFKKVGLDAGPLRENLAVFREKFQAILDEQDLLVEELAKLDAESEPASGQEISGKQASIDGKTLDLADFYKTGLRKSVEDLMYQLQ